MNPPAISASAPLPDVAVSAQPRQRPPLRRPRSGRIIAGVSAGLADHLGLGVRYVRVLMICLVLLNGAGIALYLWLWALVPTVTTEVGTTSQPATAAPDGVRRRPLGRRRSADAALRAVPRDHADPPSHPHADPVADAPIVTPKASSGARFLRRRGMRELAGGLLLILAAVPLATVLLQGLSPLGVWAVVGLVAGTALIYYQLDTVEVLRWRAGPRVLLGLGLRVVLGLLLVLAGLATLAFTVIDLSNPLSLLVAMVAIIGGALVVLAPWIIRLVRALSAEQQAHAREQVRADMAAHLHDSVLQTLALIQRSNTDPAQVVRLARRQERELRGYLYDAGSARAGTIAAAVRELVDDVEDLHTATVDLIIVGDGVVDDHAQALLAALREAMVNAAQHAGGTVSVYVEVSADQIEAFVRDRGPGFVLDDVPVDRLGVRRSIVGRMQRHNGTAQIRSVPGEGTEVRLSAPSGYGDHQAQLDERT